MKNTTTNRRDRLNQKWVAKIAAKNNHPEVAPGVYKVSKNVTYYYSPIKGMLVIKHKTGGSPIKKYIHHNPHYADAIRAL